MVKNLPAKAGDPGLIPESGRSPGVGNGNPLQYSGLKNPMERGTLKATVHGVTKKSHTTEQLAFSLSLISIHDYWKDHNFDYTDLCRQ